MTPIVRLMLLMIASEVTMEWSDRNGHSRAFNLVDCPQGIAEGPVRTSSTQDHRRLSACVCDALVSTISKVASYRTAKRASDFICSLTSTTPAVSRTYSCVACGYGLGGGVGATCPLV